MKIKILDLDDETLVDKIKGFFGDIYIYSWLYNLKWKIIHILRQTHLAKTGLSMDYHDKTEMMKGALFTFVEDYIARDEEDAMSVVVIENDLRASIIDILHFYRIRSPEMEKRKEFILNILYGESKFVQIKDSNLYELLHRNNYTGEERKKLRKEYDNIEKKLYEETEKMLKKCVEIREYLWS